MPTDSGKKVIILYILQILQRYTDADHPMTQQQIMEKLRSDYDLEVNRSTVKRNLSDLLDAGYDIQYSSWKGKSPKWQKDTDVRYLDRESLYNLPVAGLIWEINAPEGGLAPSITVVGEKAPTVYASGGQVDVFRAFMPSTTGPDVWKTDVTRIRGNTATRLYNGYDSLGVASAGNYYAVVGNRMDVDDIRDIIETVRDNDLKSEQAASNSNQTNNSQTANNSNNSSANGSQSNSGQSGNSSGSSSGNGSNSGQEGIKGSGNGSGDVDKDDDAEQVAATPATSLNYLVFGLMAAVAAGFFFFIILLKRRKEEDEQ